MKNQSCCVVCGRFFLPHARVVSRQKTCGVIACRKKRKSIQDEKWRDKNPDYFRGRSGYTKAWRQAHPGAQKVWRDTKGREMQVQIRPQTLMQSVRLHLRLIPPIGEIQVQMCRLRQAGGELWVDGSLMHPT